MTERILAYYSRAFSGLPRDIWVMSGAMFVNRFGTMVLPFLTLYLTERLLYTETQAGAMLSVYGCGAVVGTFLGGRLCRPVGPVRLQVILLMASVPVFLAVPMFSTAIGIGAALFVLSIFVEGVRPANSAAVACLAPDGLQARAFGLQRLALNLGMSFGPAIGGALAMVSFGWLFVADAATTFLCAVTLFVWFGTRRQASIDLIDARMNTNSGNQKVSPMRDGQFVVFWSLTLVTAIVFFQFHVTYPLYLRDHYGLSKFATGMIYAINTLVVVLFEMVILERVRCFRMVHVIAAGAFFSCLGFGMLPFGDTVVWCVLSMIVITIGEMLWMPLASAWVAGRSDRGDRGRYMGWYAMTYSIAGIVAPLLGGWLGGINPEMIWHLSTVTGVLVFLGFVGLDASLRQTEPGSSCAGGQEMLLK